jgi:hypothetical protein
MCSLTSVKKEHSFERMTMQKNLVENQCKRRSKEKRTAF